MAMVLKFFVMNSMMNNFIQKNTKIATTALNGAMEQMIYPHFFALYVELSSVQAYTTIK